MLKNLFLSLAGIGKFGPSSGTGVVILGGCKVGSKGGGATASCIAEVGSNAGGAIWGSGEGGPMSGTAGIITGGCKVGSKWSGGNASDIAGCPTGIVGFPWKCMGRSSCPSPPSLSEPSASSSPIYLVQATLGTRCQPAPGSNGFDRVGGGNGPAAVGAPGGGGSGGG